MPKSTRSYYGMSNEQRITPNNQLMTLNNNNNSGNKNNDILTICVLLKQYKATLFF